MFPRKYRRISLVGKDYVVFYDAVTHMRAFGRFNWVVTACDHYHTPILITESSMSCHDLVSLDGKVHDPNRINFVHRYLLNVQETMQSGVNVLGHSH